MSSSMPSWQSTTWPSPLVVALNKIGRVHPATEQDGGSVFEAERCGHQVHVECLAQYFSHGHAKCPLCRAPWDAIPATEIVRSHGGAWRRGWESTASSCTGASLSAVLVALAPLALFAWAYLVLELLKLSGVVLKGDDAEGSPPFTPQYLTQADVYDAMRTMRV